MPQRGRALFAWVGKSCIVTSIVIAAGLAAAPQTARAGACRIVTASNPGESCCNGCCAS